MIIEANIKGEKCYFLVTAHAEMRLLARGITESMITETLEMPEQTTLNSRGREEYTKNGLKVIVDDDPEDLYDGFIITAHYIE